MIDTITKLWRQYNKASKPKDDYIEKLKFTAIHLRHVVHDANISNKEMANFLETEEVAEALMELARLKRLGK